MFNKKNYIIFDCFSFFLKTYFFYFKRKIFVNKMCGTQQRKYEKIELNVDEKI